MNYKISNAYLTVEISSKGGELRSICDADGKEYLWQGDDEVWEDRAPNLFPYIGRMTQKTYQYENKEYHMNIHGFLPETEMMLVSKKEDVLILGLNASEITLEQYPFLFTLEIVYQLKEATLEITYQVKNKDSKTMYFGIGGHPGFIVPMEDGLSFEDYRIDFGENAVLRREVMSEDCFVLEKDEVFELEDRRYLNLKHELFDDDAIILSKMPKQVVLGSAKGNREIVVAFEQMDYLGIWHRPFKKPDYVCIEPWTSLPSRKDVIEDIAKQPSLISLDSGEVYQNMWSISIGEKKKI